MGKHTQTTRQLLPTNCLSVFHHFVIMAFKGLKCKMLGVKNIFILGLVSTTRINIGILEKLMLWFKIFARYEIDNRNIWGKHLYKDGLHVIEKVK